MKPDKKSKDIRVVSKGKVDMTKAGRAADAYWGSGDGVWLWI